MKFSNFHLVVSSFAAVAGVTLAAYQTLAPAGAPQQQPVTVTVAVEPAKTVSEEGPAAAKSDQAVTIATAALDLAHGASFTAALKDGSETRYAFADLFDGKPESFLVFGAPDRELNILVNFNSQSAQPVTALEYAPPPGAASGRLATAIDVMVLPEGQMEASGRPVMSFSLQTSPGSQTFAIPGNASGKGLWLRVTGPEGAETVAVGDFHVLREQVAP
jgi:hypothetical protein